EALKRGGPDGPPSTAVNAQRGRQIAYSAERKEAMSTMRQLASGLAVFLVLAVLTAAPTPAQGESRVTALAIDPLTPTTLYAATSDASGSCCGLLKSIDGGATWSATPLTNVSVSALAIAP